LTTESSPNTNKTESFEEHLNKNVCDIVKCKDLFLGLMLPELVCVKMLRSIHAPLSKFRFKENHTKFSGLVPKSITVKQKGEAMTKKTPLASVATQFGIH